MASYRSRRDGRELRGGIGLAGLLQLPGRRRGSVPVHSPCAFCTQLRSRPRSRRGTGSACPKSRRRCSWPRSPRTHRLVDDRVQLGLHARHGVDLPGQRRDVERVHHRGRGDLEATGTSTGAASSLTVAMPCFGIDEQPLPVERDHLDRQRLDLGAPAAPVDARSGRYGSRVGCRPLIGSGCDTMAMSSLTPATASRSTVTRGFGHRAAISTSARATSTAARIARTRGLAGDSRVSASDSVIANDCAPARQAGGPSRARRRAPVHA